MSLGLVMKTSMHTKRPWDKPKVGATPCKPGEHKPSYKEISVTRFNGAQAMTVAPADTYNRCRLCGIEIYNCQGKWVIDTGERQRWETGEKKKGFVFVELVREVVCCGPAPGVPCPKQWKTTTKSSTLKRCPSCQRRYRSFRAVEIKQARRQRNEISLREI